LKKALLYIGGNSGVSDGKEFGVEDYDYFEG
jgi:hypothetical protein